MSTVPARMARVAVLAATALLAVDASALPSFARQTGQDCAACHVGAYGPQLTPYGVKFKMGGYTDSDGKDGHVPLSAMILGSYTSTNTDLDPADVPAGFDTNRNTALQELAVFYAGKIGEHGGAFVQTTYSGVDKITALDQVDLRYTHEKKIGGHDAILGLTVNNNPGVTDPFNTLAVWRFPFASSDFMPTPDAGTQLNGGLEGQVIGVSGYASLDNGLYAELGAYDSLSQSFLDNVHLGRDRAIKGLSPYARLAWFKDKRRSGYSFGLVAMAPQLRDNGAGGAADKYTDIGIDGSYQYLGNRTHVFTANGSLVHESQKRDATFAAAGADNATGSLNELNLSTSYHYNKTWGVTAGYFNTSGSSDATLYSGSASGSPDSAGYTVQADFTPWGKEDSWKAPWANLRLGLQYTAYSKFNGGSDNYDGAGRNASDNNTVMAMAWTSF